MADTTDATLAAYCQALAIRRANAANRVAPIGRTELISPYTDNQGNVIYTPHQLAMQRKIAILRYDKNTERRKVDIYTRAVSQQNRVGENAANLAADGNCASDAFIPTSSTGMDVPGPAMIFTYDPSIPLYMYNAAPR